MSMSKQPKPLTAVRYWSVYKQTWIRATAQDQIPAHEWAAQDKATRARFERLPEKSGGEY